MGISELPMEILEDRVLFPWFEELPDPDAVKAYTHFISALCEMSRNAKRVTATEKPVDNEKYAFRCFCCGWDLSAANIKRGSARSC